MIEKLIESKNFTRALIIYKLISGIFSFLLGLVLLFVMLHFFIGMTANRMEGDVFIPQTHEELVQHHDEQFVTVREEQNRVRNEMEQQKSEYDTLAAQVQEMFAKNQETSAQLEAEYNALREHINSQSIQQSAVSETPEP